MKTTIKFHVKAEPIAVIGENGIPVIDELPEELQEKLSIQYDTYPAAEAAIADLPEGVYGIEKVFVNTNEA